MPGVLRFLSASEVPIGEGDTLPNRFLLFRAGVNDSSKGPALFDEQAARSVMAVFAREGVDLMIDLEHDSLDEGKRRARSDAGDAMGWCKLEVDALGAIWATDVRWSVPGAERLRSKRQRYVSPAFLADDESRVVQILNVALVAMPATYGAQPLVAASKDLSPAGNPPAHVRSKMDPEQIKAALDALEAGDAAKALELLKAIVVSAASGGVPAETPSETPEALGECAERKPTEDQKMLSKIGAHLGLSTAEDIYAEVERLSRRVAEQDAERARAEQTTRVALVGELVKLGVELPATAWQDAENKVPAKRLAAEPLAELRARVETYRAAGKSVVKAPTAPVVTLSAHEAELAKKMTPEQRARFAELRSSRKAGK